MACQDFCELVLSKGCSMGSPDLEKAYMESRSRTYMEILDRLIFLVSNMEQEEEAKMLYMAHMKLQLEALEMCMRHDTQRMTGHGPHHDQAF